MRRPEEHLITQVCQGDTEAFGELIVAHQNAVYAVVLAITGDIDTADDLTQTCFLEAFRRLGELRDRDRFGPWLHAIARNRSRDWLRQQSRAPDLSGDPSELRDAARHELPEDPQARALASERDEAVRRAVSTLSAEYRSVVLLRYIGELDYADIADALGISVSAVKMRWHRARIMLEERLSEWVPEWAPEGPA